MIVPDLLADDLALVLCGTAPSRASKEALAYYAHPGNIFWKTLFQVGLTPRQLAPHEYPEMLRHGIGLTDLNKTEWGADAELSPAGFDIAAFTVKMRRFRPGVVAFDSKFAARTYFGRRSGFAYGLQPETLDGIPLFVVPSTSGRARRYFEVEPWEQLARLVRRA
jgi:TDG/mug DNA glycosylase family protein